MNGQWIEVFRAGRNRDSRGRERVWTEKDLDYMVEHYDPAHHEAPATIGHPKDTAPAYGWVEALKRVGNTLLAKFRQVAPEFAQGIKEGRWKKRSIRVNPDGTLGHVAFLGAVAPAIKGLKDIEFSEGDDFFDYDFNEPDQEEEHMKKTVEELQHELEAERQKTAALEKERNDFKAKADKDAADFAEAQKKTRQKEISDFIEAGIKEGKILPAWKTAGLADFMGALDEQGGEYEFSEGKKESALDWFKGFIADFSAHPLFKEMARPAKDEDKEAADYAEDEKLAAEIAGYAGTTTK